MRARIESSIEYLASEVFGFSRLIKLAEQILLNSPYKITRRSLSRFFGSPSNKEIEADEQPLQGYYPLEVQAA